MSTGLAKNADFCSAVFRLFRYTRNGTKIAKNIDSCAALRRMRRNTRRKNRRYVIYVVLSRRL